MTIKAVWLQACVMVPRGMQAKLVCWCNVGMIAAERLYISCSQLSNAISQHAVLNKNLCGRDGRTICGPQCVPKSTCVSL